MDEQALLRTIFLDLDIAEYIEILAVGPDRSRKRHEFVQSVVEAHDIAREVGESANVYFGICPRRERSGRRAAVSRCPTTWADIDAKDFGDGKEGALLAAQSLILPPSFIVDTGHGYQTYWLLHEPCEPNELEPVLRDLRQAVQGDSVCDAGRRFRVPGTFNVKSDPPLLCQAISQRPTLRYTLRDLVAATRVSEKTYARIRTGGHRGFKSRSERDWAVIRELKRLGMSEEAIRLVFDEWPVGDKIRDPKTDGDKYLARTFKNVRKAQEEARRVAAPAFAERGDAYWVVTSKGEKQVSTFLFDPIRLLEGQKEDTLLGDVYALGYHWPNVPLSKSAFNRTEALLRQLNLASWQWLGTDKEVRALLPYLMGKLIDKGLPRAIATSALGRVDNFWVTPSGVMGPEGFISDADAPLVYLPTKRETPRVSYSLLEDDEYGPLVQSIWKHLLDINRPEVIWPLLGWAMASPLKPALEASGVRFPSLNLYGTRGSGKTSTLLQVVQPLLGYIEPRTYDCNTTPFVLLSLFASTNAIPVSFSEFRRSSLANREYAKLQRYVLLAYDVGHDPRGRPDQTTVDYPLSAPFTLDGEDTMADAAAKERMIVANLSPETIVEGGPAWQAFQELVQLPLELFAGRYVQHTLRYDAAEIFRLWSEAYGVMQRAFQQALPDRVRRNLAVCVCGLRLVREHLARYDVDLPEISHEFVQSTFELALAEIVEGPIGRTRLLVDEFIEDVINELALPEGRPNFLFKYFSDDNALWVHQTTAIAWWHAKRRREGRTSLESAALKAQLRERSLAYATGPGQYIIARKAVDVYGSTKWMFGIRLDAAVQAGLDIPDSLDFTTVIVDL